jgi:hypothetical protein
MGFEPTTHCWASDFESDRWPVRLSSVVRPASKDDFAEQGNSHQFNVQNAVSQAEMPRGKIGHFSLAFSYFRARENHPALQ